MSKTTATARLEGPNSERPDVFTDPLAGLNVSVASPEVTGVEVPLWADGGEGVIFLGLCMNKVAVTQPAPNFSRLLLSNPPAVGLNNHSLTLSRTRLPSVDAFPEFPGCRIPFVFHTDLFVRIFLGPSKELGVQKC